MARTFFTLNFLMELDRHKKTDDFTALSSPSLYSQNVLHSANVSAY